ncbi:MAG: hypothetical protein IPM38_11565 [Ignavibacteria bacterium]|nr:hypothetical protein [Ignavibacteria bacterium]
MQRPKKKTAGKISKGYRLRKSTHLLIEKIQNIICENKDVVITRSLKLYYSQINSGSNIPASKKIKINKSFNNLNKSK